MSTYSFRFKGIKVEVWEKSFRVEGMSDVVFLGTAVSRQQIEHLIDSIYEAIREKGELAAKKVVVAHFAKHIEKVLNHE